MQQKLRATHTAHLKSEKNTAYKFLSVSKSKQNCLRQKYNHRGRYGYFSNKKYFSAPKRCTELHIHCVCICEETLYSRRMNDANLLPMWP